MKYLLLAILLLAWVPFFPACTKNYSVGPTAVVNTPTATPTCSFPPTTPWSTTGISLQAGIDGFNFTNGIHTSQVLYFCVDMLVNNLPESTATVTVTGPGGLNITLPYSNFGGTTSSSGDAEYQTFQLGTLVPGGTYVVTAVTSAGTATATLTAPGGAISLASDGSSFSWTQGGQWNVTQVSQAFSGITYLYQSCSTASFSTNLPASAYPVPGQEYGFSANCSNYTTSLTNAIGQYWITQNSTEVLNFPTVTSPSPSSDIFSLSTNVFDQPIQGNVSITLQTAETGTINLSILDANGRLTKTLNISSYSSLPSSPSLYAWDGKDNYGSLVGDGMYFVYLNEPTDPKFLPLLLER